MKTKAQILSLLREKQPYLHAEFNVSRIGIFGSYAKELSNESSDIDIVVEFSGPIGFRFMELADYLEELLGKKVDLLTSDGIDNIRLPGIAQSIEKDITYA